MKLTPSAIGYLSPIAAPRDDRRLRSTIRPASTRGRQPARTTAPWGTYKRRIKRTHKNDDPLTYPAHCLNFKYCDEQYQKLCPEQRDTWRRGIKRPHMSPYDLFMHEALHAAHNRWPLPDAPSISGGYSLTHVKPGTKIPTSPAPRGTWPRCKITYIRLAEVQYLSVTATRATWDYTPDPAPPSPNYDTIIIATEFDPAIGKYRSVKQTNLATGYLDWGKRFDHNAPWQARLRLWYPDGFDYLYCYLTINQPWELQRWDQRPWISPPDYPDDWL